MIDQPTQPDPRTMPAGPGLDRMVAEECADKDTLKHTALPYARFGYDGDDPPSDLVIVFDPSTNPAWCGFLMQQLRELDTELIVVPATAGQYALWRLTSVEYDCRSQDGSATFDEVLTCDTVQELLSRAVVIAKQAQRERGA